MPLALTGPEFLAVYVVLLLVLMIAAGIVRSRLRGPSDDRFPAQIDSYQAAYLAGGVRSAAEAAIVALTSRGALRVDTGGRFVAIEPRPQWLHPLEDAIWTAASLSASSSPLGAGASWLAERLERRAAERPGMTQGQVATFQRIEGLLRGAGQPVPGATAPRLLAAAAPALGPVGDQLRQMGLVMGEPQIATVRTVPAMLVLAAAVVGGVRLALGMAGGRPVGFLIALLVATVVIALLYFRRPGPRTHRGDRLLNSLRRNNAALRTSAAAAAAALAGADIALAVALWGPAVLAGSPLDDVRQLLRPPGTSGSSDSSSSSGSDSGSSCSGGSSCGGGCGGGCGG